MSPIWSYKMKGGNYKSNWKKKVNAKGKDVYELLQEFLRAESLALSQYGTTDLTFLFCSEVAANLYIVGNKPNNHL